jgi:hypothetical protein
MVRFHFIMRRVKRHLYLDTPARPVQPPTIKRVPKAFHPGVKLIVIKKFGNEVSAYFVAWYYFTQYAYRVRVIIVVFVKAFIIP